jgi:hypothetical protein
VFALTNRILLNLRKNKVIDSFGKLLSPNYDANIALFTFIGEVLLIFWLLLKGSKIPDQSKQEG